MKKKKFKKPSTKGSKNSRDFCLLSLHRGTFRKFTVSRCLDAGFVTLKLFVCFLKL